MPDRLRLGHADPPSSAIAGLTYLVIVQVTIVLRGPSDPAVGFAANTVDPESGRISGFLLDGGVVTPIDVPGSLSTNALDINDRGQIAGVYADTQRMGHGYVRDRNGAFTTIDVPGATLTFPLGINNRGHVVGMFRDANQVGHGFLYKDGSFTTVDHPLASSDSWPQDVNDRSQILGFYERGTVRRRV